MSIRELRLRQALVAHRITDTPLNRYTVTELARPQRGSAAALEASAALLASVERRAGELSGQLRELQAAGDGLGVMKLMTELNQVRAQIRPPRNPSTQEREPAADDMRSADAFFNGYLSDQRARFAALLLSRDGLLDGFDQLAAPKIVSLPGGGSAALKEADGERALEAERGGQRVFLQGGRGTLHLVADGREQMLTPALVARDASMPPELMFGGARPRLATCALLSDALRALGSSDAARVPPAGREVARFRARQDERIARYFRATDGVGLARGLVARVQSEGVLTQGDADNTVKLGAARRAGYERALILQCHASGVVHYVDLAALARSELAVTGIEGRSTWRYHVPARGAASCLDEQPVFAFAFALELLSTDAEPAKRSKP